MKIKKLMPVIAVLIAILGYFLGHLNNSGIDININSLKQVTNPPENIIKASSEGMAPGKYIYALVTKVTDGDTLEIVYKEESYKVRFLDMDTPESVKQGVSVQPYSIEASNVVKKLVLNQSVKLVFDKGLKDRYGRLLAFIILNDGTFLNAFLVKNGFARVEIVSPNNTYSSYFNSLLNEAVTNKTGFWALPTTEQPFVINDKGNYIPRYLAK